MTVIENKTFDEERALYGSTAGLTDPPMARALLKSAVMLGWKTAFSTCGIRSGMTKGRLLTTVR